MSEIVVSNPKQPNREEHWANHIKCWEECNLSQPEYCKKAGIGYAAFVYWRGKLSAKAKMPHLKFVPVSVTTEKQANKETPKSIQIKLTTGHIVYIPATLPINDIASLINLIGNSHA